MADISSAVSVRDQVPQQGAKQLVITTPATADSGDTIDLTLSRYGITTFLAVSGFIHTTENSVVVAEAPTTAVATGVLTITLGGATNDKKRVFIVTGI